METEYSFLFVAILGSLLGGIIFLYGTVGMSWSYRRLCKLARRNNDTNGIDLPTITPE